MGTAEFRWLSPEQDLRLEGMALIGHSYWKYLMMMAMACLLGEMLFLAWGRTPVTSGSKKEPSLSSAGRNRGAGE
jgi:hypothetical protein